MPTEWAVARHLWRDHAACIDTPTAWFYANERRPELIEQALMTCAGCCVREQCLADALDDEVGDRVVYGVRGGLLASERVLPIRRRAVAAGDVHKVFAAAI